MKIQNKTNFDSVIHYKKILEFNHWLLIQEFKNLNLSNQITSGNTL